MGEACMCLWGCVGVWVEGGDGKLGRRGLRYSKQTQHLVSNVSLLALLALASIHVKNSSIENESPA